MTVQKTARRALEPSFNTAGRPPERAPVINNTVVIAAPARSGPMPFLG